ncbi:MAG: Gfo/Idh/MocA family oxidoreductase [Cytophagaceae bacterium]|jgi:predicted dehydrogenase|nr:Gfo/Idh/MocA family oxidoreductase [Cytophagaceae bacterium]
MEKKKIKFAVIGCGHIGKRHASMVKQNPDSELVALADIRPKEELGLESFGEVAFFNSAEALLASSLDIDVVNVCSPNGYHVEHSLKALDSKRHVVCEKPMGLTKASCEELIYKALQVSRQVFCVMQNRYSPPSEWLKSIVSSGKLGKIYLVQINCYWNRDHRYYKPGNWHGNKQLDGGTLFTQFSHFIDIMYWLFGDIQNIKARMFDFNHKGVTEFEDSGLVSFEFTNGGMGSLNFSTSVYDSNLESSLTIIAENGSIKVGGQYMNEVEYCHVKDYTMPTLAPSNPPNDYGAYKGSAANHHYIIENVVSTLLGNSTATTNALEGLKVVEIIERIYQSAKFQKQS